MNVHFVGRENNMKEEIFEAIETVGKLNQEIYDLLGENYGETLPIFELQTDGFLMIITFVEGFKLWFSGEDDREFYEDKNEYEPLEVYLRRESQKIVNIISHINMRQK